MNVYGPCELARKKKELWKEIVSLEQQRGGQMWYIVRDFNDVKCEDEILDRSQFLIDKKPTTYKIVAIAKTIMDLWWLSAVNELYLYIKKKKMI